MKPKNIILEGVTGSVAYGLDTEFSDVDIKGIFVAPTSKVLSLNKPKESVDHTDPDWAYHEIEKYIKLAMGGNPTILELLFLEDYTTLTDAGKMLVDNREHFLSNTVRRSYGGYCLSQARKLNARGNYGHGRNNRFSKHSRHLMRLLMQGKELLETGKITIRVTPEMRKQIFEFGEKEVDEVVSIFSEEFNKFDNIKSVLPDKPNREKINEILLDIRGMY